MTGEPITGPETARFRPTPPLVELERWVNLLVTLIRKRDELIFAAFDDGVTVEQVIQALTGVTGGSKPIGNMVRGLRKEWNAR